MGITRLGKEGERRKGNRMECWASCQGRKAGRGARNRWRQEFWARRGRESWLGDDEILQRMDEQERIHATFGISAQTSAKRVGWVYADEISTTWCLQGSALSSPSLGIETCNMHRTRATGIRLNGLSYVLRFCSACSCFACVCLCLRGATLNTI